MVVMPDASEASIDILVESCYGCAGERCLAGSTLILVGEAYDKYKEKIVERVRKIKSLNAQGTIPDDLEAVEVVSGKAKEVEPEAVELVGQISLRTLEKAEKKKKQQQQQNSSASSVKNFISCRIPFFRRQ